MAQEIRLSSGQISGRIQIVQAITIVWMIVEAGVSLMAAWNARSPALLAFGGDSLVELFSASIVFWRFTTRTTQELAERTAAKIAGALLFVLGAFVVAGSLRALLGYNQPGSSRLGIGVLIAAIVIMPWLAREKRRLSAVTASAALRADAAQSNLCAYLAMIALGGLAANAIWHIGWADPIAALAVMPFIVYEGVEAIRGRPCGCH
ncbi:MAG TPA: cation transporter [Candidatus Acidoferrum sp.]